MKNKRNIVITFAPHGRRWFQDIAIAAARSLKELGHDCNVIACNKIDDFNRDSYDTILVLAPHTYTQLNLSPNFMKLPDKTYIAWCLEQTPHMDRTCDIMDRNWQRTLLYIDKFDFFFTESEAKTQYVVNQGRQAFTATIGYHPHFTMYNDDLENAPKQYDVFFLGAMYPRRSKVLSRLRELGVKMYPTTNNMFDPVVKANAAKMCKVGLNIHHNNVGYFEKPRIIQDYMANKVLVVTETIDHMEGFKNGKHLITAPHNKLADTVFEWCRKPTKDIERVVNGAFKYISTEYTMKESMKNLIDTVDSNEKKRFRKATGERLVPSITDEATEKQHRARYEFFQSFAMDKTVLDVGCGSGYGTNFLATIANKAIGIDMSDEAIDHARASYMIPKFGKGNVLELPYGRNTFDTIYCFEMIEHVSDYKLALVEMSRVLKKTGKIIVSTPNKDIVSEGSDIPKNEFHVKEWNLQEYVKELKKTFSKVVTYGQPNAAPWSVHFEAKQDDLFFICVCSK